MIFRTPHYNLVMVMEPMTKGSPGRRIRFQDGVYVTSSKEEIDFIKQSRSFGVTIFADEEQPKPQPKPRSRRGRQDSQRYWIVRQVVMIWMQG